MVDSNSDLKNKAVSAGHLAALDGLRGVAATVVVACHCLGAVKLPNRSALLEGPLALLVNATGAVQLFFVLSGFVLAASLARNESLRQLPQYFVRRIFRIHPPYMFAVLAAWCASFFYAPRSLAGAGPLLRHLSSIHLGPVQLLESLAFPSRAFLQLSVGWTLEVEMIFSFLLPLMAAIALRVHWAALLMLCLPPLLVGPDGLEVGKFALDFGLGIALFAERERLATWFGGLSPAASWCWMVAAIAVFHLPWFLGWNPKPGGEPDSILVMGLGAAMLTAGAAFQPRLGAPFRARPLLFLGRVSYSLYLLHYPILILLAPRLLRALPSLDQAVWLFACVFAVALPLSALSHRFVERPAIEIGNRLCRMLAPRVGVRVVESRLAAAVPTGAERYSA